MNGPLGEFRPFADRNAGISGGVLGGLSGAAAGAVAGSLLGGYRGLSEPEPGSGRVSSALRRALRTGLKGAGTGALLGGAAGYSLAPVVMARLEATAPRHGLSPEGIRQMPLRYAIQGATGEDADLREGILGALRAMAR